MRKTNPQAPFYGEDLIPEEGEPGNAFWAYHVGNNIARLLNVDGTIIVPDYKDRRSPVADPNMWQWGVHDDYMWVVDIPTEKLGFRAAPYIQFTADVASEEVAGPATIYLDPSLLTGFIDGRHATIGYVDDTRLYFTYHRMDPFESNYAVPFKTPSRLGQRDGDWMMPESWDGRDMPLYRGYELMYFLPASEKDGPFKYQTVENGVTWYHWEVSAGLARHILNYGMPSPLQFTRGQVLTGTYLWFLPTISPQGIAVERPITRSVVRELNPPYIEAYLDARRLRIKWMLLMGGTIYYKIYGV